jgi:hypothetical protein
LLGELDHVVALCCEIVDLVTRGVVTQTGAMMQLAAHRKFLENLEPWNIKVWNMVPRTYKSLQKLADTAKNELSDYHKMIHVFDVCRACGECVFDGIVCVAIFCCLSVLTHHIHIIYLLHSFSESKAHLQVCPDESCKEPRTNTCQLLVVDIVSRFQKLMTHKNYAKAFRFTCPSCFLRFA